MTQARPTDPADADSARHLSRNEIETLCLKAARGAGFAWGLAEEAGFAAGWLATQGQDGSAALLGYLQGPQPGGVSVTDRQWRAGGDRPLCPIFLGATLDDHALLEAGPLAGPLDLGRVSHPVLLVPFVARMAQACGQPLTLRWPEGAVTVQPGAKVRGLAALAQVGSAVMGLAVASQAVGPDAMATPPKMAALRAATVDGLNALALRTTVPASDTSRQGAGAGGSDND